MRFLLSLKDNSLVRATSAVASLALLVKLLALAKEMVIAAKFGVGREMDIFALALAIATFPVVLMAGTLREAFLPVYVSLRSQERLQEAGALFQAIGRRLLAGMVILALLMALLAPWWIPGMVPTWPQADQLRLRYLVFLLLASLPLASGAMHVTSALHSQSRFALPTLTPALNSLALLVFLYLPLSWGAFQLGTGLLTGAILELACLWWVFRRINPWPPQGVSAPAEALRTVSRLYLPTLGASFFMSSTQLVDLTITSWLPIGAVSTLSYAGKLPGVVLTLTAGALGTTLFPSFSRLAGLEQWSNLRKQATKALLLSLAATLLLSVLLFLLSPILVKLVFQRGSFGVEQVGEVARVQGLFFLETPLYVGCVIVVRVIQAMQQHRINLFGTIINGGLNFALDLAFLPLFGVLGIALSSICVYGVSFLFLSAWAHHYLNIRERREVAA